MEIVDLIDEANHILQAVQQKGIFNSAGFGVGTGSSGLGGGAGVAPKLGPLSTPIGELYRYTLEGAGRTSRDLRELQDWTVEPRLLQVAGVTDITKTYRTLEAMQKGEMAPVIRAARLDWLLLSDEYVEMYDRIAVGWRDDFKPAGKLGFLNVFARTASKK